MKSFSKSFMQENCGCYLIEQLNNTSFMQVQGNEVSLLSIVESEIPLKDKFWFVCKKVLSIKENRELAISVAELVLPIYEKSYTNKGPREAIKAAKSYLAGNISSESFITKKVAAKATVYSADVANAAANAANAAANAAYAAVNVAYAAAYAATNAVYSANAAYAAASAAVNVADIVDIKNKLQSILIEIANK